MGKDAIEGLITVATMIVTVAIVAVLVSKNSQTGDVLSAGGTALANALRAAMSPTGVAQTAAAGNTQLNQTGYIYT